MSITSFNSFIEALDSQIRFSIAKRTMNSEGAGTYQDLSSAEGVPAAISTPASAALGGTTYTSANAGLPFPTPSLGQKTYVACFSANTSTTGGLLTLYDRLWSCSGVTMTPTGTTTTITPAPTLPRHTTGAGVELYYACFTTPTAQVGTQISVSYTNSDGTSGRTATIDIGLGTTPFAIAGTLVKAKLQDNDKGVQTVASVTNTATMTGGSHGLLLLKRIVDLPLTATLASGGNVVTALRNGFAEVAEDASLNLMILCSTARSGDISGLLTLVQG